MRTTEGGAQHQSLSERAWHAISQRNLSWIFALHARIYRATGGRLGARLHGVPVLLLTTRGRRTGKLRTRTLMYLADDNRLVLVASHAGEDRPPAWLLNLQTEPRASVQIGTRSVPVVAHTADRDERTQLWPRVVAMNPFYADHQQRTRREIALVVLEPQG